MSDEQFELLKEQYESLRKQNAEMLNYISSIAREMGEFKQETLKRLDNIEKEVAGLKTQVGKLEERVEGIEYFMKNMANDMYKLRAADEKLSDRISKLENQAA